MTDTASFPRPARGGAGVQLSIEIFPPKHGEAETQLARNLDAFVGARPRFISVTCGAGGNGWEGTFPLVCAVRERWGVPVAAHMTCASASRGEVDAVARRYWEAGVRRIVALRGDAPQDAAGGYRPGADAYPFAAELVAGLRRVAPFEISVACYPEVHPEAPSAAADLDNLARKVDAGATTLITQYCFDTDRILRLRDAVQARGLRAEFVPGIMPIHSFRQIKRFSARCGAKIPAWLEAAFAGVEEGSALHGMVAAAVAVEQCRRLMAEGLGAFHVYALNRAELPLALTRLLQIEDQGLPAAA